MRITTNGCRLLAAVLLSAAGQVCLLAKAHGQATSLDSRLDAQQARTDAAAATGSGSLVSRYAFGETSVARSPYSDDGSPAPTASFLFNFFLPVYYNSNAETVSTGGTQTFETTPEIRFAASKQLDQVPVKLSMLGDANSDRYASSNGANADAAYMKFRAQYNSKQNDQEFQPFFQYATTTAFMPTFSASMGTRNDFTLGFDKAFNFDYLFRTIGGPESPYEFRADTSRATVWSFGFTGTFSRRLNDVGPSSYAAVAAPSVTYNLTNYPNANSADAQWHISFEVDVTRRWYDAVVGFERRDWKINPILTVEFVPPLSWFRGENKLQQDNKSKALGRPKIDFQVAFIEQDSNKSGSSYRQWTIGPMVKTAWNF
jgi:hypothetical protein